MAPRLRFTCLLVLLLASRLAFGQAARDTVVDLTAAVQESAPQITLTWQVAAQPVTLQKVYRRLKGAPTWIDIATPANGAVTYTDTAVAVGVSYEYFVYRILGSAPGFAAGYLSAGIKVPVVEGRGRVILLVDDTMAVPLASELTRFVSDLTGDGWMVSRQDVSRSATVPAIKTIVQNFYNTDPANTRSLILFGRVPVPYSGDLAPDGHPEHRGAWPADVYYADLDGDWTDTTVDNAGAARVENRNVPGDGKFDQSTLPSDVELAVGRIDLANMGGVPTGSTETGLLQQYLNRDHDFRFKTGAFANIPRRGLIADNFGYFGGEAFSSSGWRNFRSFFGSAPGSIVEGAWFTTLQQDTYLCAYGCGSGSYTGAGGIGTSNDFATIKSLAVFNMLFGSYFGDWDNGDNFLRAPLAGRADSLGLVSVWAGRPHWHLYDMALGGTVGNGARVTQNNGGFAAGGYVVNSGGRNVHIALMGDPTLRLHPVSPVTNLIADATSGSPVLSWTASADTGIAGYTVSRAASPAGPFVRLGGALATGTNYTDFTGTPGQSYTYMVRAVKLESSAGGTYFNPSQGVFAAGIFAGPVLREINLTGNGQLIPSGDTVAVAGNGTEFGGAEVGVQTVTRTFTIANAGTNALNLTGTPVVQISGTNAGDFTVTVQPASGALQGGGVTFFQISFTPAALGSRAATVTIASNDANENPFTFAIRGTGLVPSPELAFTPAAITRTLAPNATATDTLTISNTGPGTLTHSISSSLNAYSFRDSNAFGGPAYAFIDISGTGTEVTGFSNLDDAASAPIALGFTFPFFGNSFTSLRVNTNGFVSFTDTSSPFGNTSLPTIEAPGNMIAAFWDDLILDATGKIFTQQIGDRFVVQFENVRLFSSPTQRVTCEIVLRASGEILLQYKDVTETDHDYTVGLQNDLRTLGLQIALNTNLVQPGLAIRILPGGFYSWLSLSANSGSVAAASSQLVNVTLNSAGLSPGTYFATLAIATNDADEALVSVPVQLTVTGPEVEVLGNGLSIADGDSVPSVVDLTDFGRTRVNTGSVARTFTIRNTGTSALTIGTVAASGSGFSITTPPTASIPAAGSTTFVVTFAPTTAGVLSRTITFATNDADEAAFDFVVTGLALSPVESWRLANFGTTANAGNAADDADPEGDGVVNELEYAFTLNPLLPNLSGLPVVTKNAAGYLQIQFTRNVLNTDLTYTVQASSDLAPMWTNLASSVNGAVTAASGAHSAVESGSGEVKTVMVEDVTPTTAHTHRFLRVRVTRN